MTGSGFIPLSMSIMVVMATLASTAGAQCAACAGEGDWSASASAFLEGKPIDETPPLWGPKAARLTNSQFESQTRENAGNASEAANRSEEMLSLQIDLKNASALPSSISAGSPVMISAVIADASGSPDNQSASGSAAAVNVSAVINDPAGREVGRVNLERTPGGEYAGIWSGSMTAGIYEVTLVASRSGTSRTFDDALQIEIMA